jgi:ubiquinone/menaquinone biosynthesis C-methylase UbiE
LKAAGNSKTILDLGAGHGNDLLSAKNIFPDADLHAVEIYPPYVKELEEKKINVHKLNIEKDPLPFPDNSIDVIISNQIIEHLKEIFWVFHEATRVLKKDGSFIIGVPNIAALHNRLIFLFGIQPTPLKNWSAHVRGWTKNDLKRFLNKCFPDGYSIKDFGGSNFYPFPPFLAKPLAKIFPNLAWSIFFHLKKKKDYTDDFITLPLKEKLETNFYLGG